MPDLEHELRQQVRTLLKLRGMTQQELASEVGVTPKHMSMMLTGGARLSLRMAEMMGLAMGVQFVVAHIVKEWAPRRGGATR